MTVHHDPAAHRFTMTVDGHEAGLDYQLQEGWMMITHTSVPQPIVGRGIASKLTRAAFEHAREQGWNVRPACSYAAAWVERHPEYNQLLG
ncbi:MAG: GNAT family N-acetyltransferase [Lysobacter sp.]